MQTANINFPVTITGRHVSITEAMREHAQRKVESLHLDYPRITEAKVILAVEGDTRHQADVILHCAGHITIEASSETLDMYSSIDETLSKIARRMRKYKTRMLSRSHRPRKRGHNGEKILAQFQADLDAVESADHVEPGQVQKITDREHALVVVHKDRPELKRLSELEAIEALELSTEPFFAFEHDQTQKLSILFRGEDGDYHLVEPNHNSEPSTMMG